MSYLSSKTTVKDVKCVSQFLDVNKLVKFRENYFTLRTFNTINNTCTIVLIPYTRICVFHWL